MSGIGSNIGRAVTRSSVTDNDFLSQDYVMEPIINTDKYSTYDDPVYHVPEKGEWNSGKTRQWVSDGSKMVEDLWNIWKLFGKKEPQYPPYQQQSPPVSGGYPKPKKQMGAGAVIGLTLAGVILIGGITFAIVKSSQ